MAEEMVRGITHFTSQFTAAAMLDGWRRDLIQGDMKGGKVLGPAEVKIRLYGRSGMNDPREQEISEFGTDITREKHPKGSEPQSRETFPDDVFMLCGSRPQIGEKPQVGETGEETNRLEMWRAYGDDGRGVALTTWWDPHQLKNEGLEIIKVEYLSDLGLEDVDSQRKRLFGLQRDESKDRYEREKLRMERMNLEVSYKHCDYESEKEIRLVCFLGDESGSVRGAGRKEIHLEVMNGRLRTYIERPVRLGITLARLDVTLGPRMASNDKRHWEKVVRWMLAQMGLSGGSVQPSQLKYIG